MKGDIVWVMKVYEDYFKYEDDLMCMGNYVDVVNKYYDFVMLFYEYGWGELFYFVYWYWWEMLWELIVRYEYYLASKFGVRGGDKVLDVGCGVGGLLWEIVVFMGVLVMGLNNNVF